MIDDNRRKGLGRGLASLLDEEGPPDHVSSDRQPMREVPIEQLVPNRYQPRQQFDEDGLVELADSVREKGILQPILVRPIGGPDAHQFEIIAGERRWRAAQRARLHRVPIIIKAMGDAEALEVALIENVQRRDLNAIEAALGYRRLMDEFGYSQEKVGEMVGKSRSAVANQLRLLGLPEPVQVMLRDGRLTEGHARTLLSAADPIAMAEQIISGGMTVRQAEGAAAGAKRGARPPSAPPKDADTLALERSLSETLGLKVKIDHRGAAGELRVTYASLEQLDEVCRLLSARHNSALAEDPFEGLPDPNLVASELAALTGTDNNSN